jgi:(4S)-4-hydroxy-5-phosphonooxypentane-2,3-dione isomerase
MFQKYQRPTAGTIPIPDTSGHPCPNRLLQKFRVFAQPAVILSTQSFSKRKIMLVVHVHIRVKAEFVERFKQATIENARHSRQEPGIARFDAVQQQDDPTRFVLVEAYRTLEATTAHKATKHYETWRDAVAPMMAEPRQSVKFTNLFPDDKGW